MVVLDAPRRFQPELAGLAGVQVRRTLAARTQFLLAFVTQQKQIDAVAGKLANPL